MQRPTRDRRLYILIFTLLGAAFVADLSVELGVASGIFYLGAIAVTYYGRRDRLPWEIGVVCSVLTVVGATLSPPGGEVWKVIANRSLALFAIWLTVALCVRARSAQRLGMARERELEQRVAERTRHLARSNQALEEGNRVLQEFAYFATHDLHTPIQAIDGFVGLLQRNYAADLDGQGRRWLQCAAENTDRLRSLMREMLDFADLGAREPTSVQPIAMADVLERTVASLDTEIRNTRATVAAEGQLPVVHGDGALLETVLRRLVENALKFRGSERPRVRVSVLEAEGEWRFAVRDNGLGIAPEHQETIFEPFSRVDIGRPEPGTGLGLSICRQVVEWHGGRLWVESEPGKGSTFFFTVPVEPPVPVPVLHAVAGETG